MTEARSRFILAAIALCAATELTSQERRRLEPGIAVGVTLRHADANAPGRDLAVNIQLSATRWGQGRLGARADASLHFFANGHAIIDCVPAVPCDQRQSLNLITAAGLTAAYRRETTDPLTLVAGVGYYQATTDMFFQKASTGNRSIGAFGTTAGFNLRDRSIGARNLGLEARVHYLPWRLGEISWLSSAALAFGL